MFKKLLAFLPVWFLYYIGEFFGNWDCIYNSIYAYNIYEKCMLVSKRIQNWAHLKTPQ